MKLSGLWSRPQSAWFASKYSWYCWSEPPDTFCRYWYQVAQSQSESTGTNIATIWEAHNYRYKNAGNSTLRHHLDSWHRAEYNRLCETYGWQNRLKSFKDTQKASEAAGGSTSRGELVPRVEYSKDEFLKRVVRWMVVSDQVSSPMIHYMFWLLTYAFQPFTKVESPELRNVFLLLCNQLAPEDIPGQGKIRGLILQHFHTSFNDLVKELQVRSCSLTAS